MLFCLFVLGLFFYYEWLGPVPLDLGRGEAWWLTQKDFVPRPPEYYGPGPLAKIWASTLRCATMPSKLSPAEPQLFTLPSWCLFTRNESIVPILLWKPKKREKKRKGRGPKAEVRPKREVAKQAEAAVIAEVKRSKEERSFWGWERARKAERKRGDVRFEVGRKRKEESPQKGREGSGKEVAKRTEEKLLPEA